MELIDYHGVPIACVEVDEAVATDWQWLRGRADVVRVESPQRGHWSALRERGFLPKPQYVSWLADTGDSSEAYQSRLAAGERQKIRVAHRHLHETGLRLSVRELDEALLSAFLVLYGQTIERMRHGVAVAYEEKDLVLADSDAYFAVCIHDGRTLAGCCLVRKDQVKGMVTVRFSAVDLPHREASLARVLYLTAADVGRDLGLRTFSLGKDRNLYGHIAKPGLLRFKRQLGLAPYPSHLIDPAVGHDQADLVLGLRSLADPSMLLGYAQDDPGIPAGTVRWPAPGGYPLRLEVFRDREELDLRPFLRKFADARIHLLGGARATLG